MSNDFCVIDVETTGFSPRLGDRVVEVAAVRMSRNGAVLDEWSTLVNPGRDVGAIHVHGITAGEVLDAPTFREVAGDLVERLDGAVFVAHNLRFDWGGRPLPAHPPEQNGRRRGGGPGAVPQSTAFLHHRPLQQRRVATPAPLQGGPPTDRRRSDGVGGQRGMDTRTRGPGQPCVGLPRRAGTRRPASRRW